MYFIHTEERKARIQLERILFLCHFYVLDSWRQNLFVLLQETVPHKTLQSVPSPILSCFRNNSVVPQFIWFTEGFFVGTNPISLFFFSFQQPESCSCLRLTEWRCDRLTKIVTSSKNEPDQNKRKIKWAFNMGHFYFTVKAGV